MRTAAASPARSLSVWHLLLMALALGLLILFCPGRSAAGELMPNPLDLDVHAVHHIQPAAVAVGRIGAGPLEQQRAHILEVVLDRRLDDGRGLEQFGLRMGRSGQQQIPQIPGKHPDGFFLRLVSAQGESTAGPASDTARPASPPAAARRFIHISPWRRWKVSSWSTFTRVSSSASSRSR